jgi:predicted nucleic acid-binding Zn ribbon protein
MFTRRIEPRLVRCTICNAEFKAIRSDAVTCSARCRKTAWLLKVSPKDQLKNAKPLVYRQICEVCLEHFTSRRFDAKTCSPRCRKARSRSSVGHLDRLDRVAKSFDKARRRREADVARREVAKAFDQPVQLKRRYHPRFGPPGSTEAGRTSYTRKIKRYQAEIKHAKNVIKTAELVNRWSATLSMLPHRSGGH